MFDVTVVDVQHANGLDRLIELHQRYLRRLYADALPAWVRLDLSLPRLRLLYVLVNDGPQSAGGLARLLG